MSNASPAFQFYASDFIGGTMEFTAEETGVYIRFLCCQWMNGGLPNDSIKLERIGGASGFAIAVPLAKFETCADGLLKNRKLEAIRAKQLEFQQKQANSGRVGADKRWGRHSKPIGEPIALRSPKDPLSTDPPPSDLNGDRIHSIHQWYEGRVGKLRFNPSWERQWYEWFQAGYLEDDFKRVVLYVETGIRDGDRNAGALKLSNLLNADNFGQDLMLAKKGINANHSRNGKHSATGLGQGTANEGMEAQYAGGVIQGGESRVPNVQQPGA